MRRKKYFAVIAGAVFIFAVLTGCGMNRTVQQNSRQDSGSTQREQELQSEIDALQQEIEDLKNGQQGGQAQTDNGQTDNAQASGGEKQAGGASDGILSLEEAQKIALERVPGATDKNISIELDRDDGWYIYEGDIRYDGMEYEFEIDAGSGSILKWEEERW